LEGSKISLANRAIGADRFLSVGLLLALALLAAGLYLPIVETRRLIFFTNAFSIIDAIQSLYLNGEYAIAAIIIGFSIIFPIAKIFVSFVLWSRNDYNENRLLAGLKWLEVLSKWSFVDVMVVAVAIVVTKSTGLANATVLVGLYLYAASAVVSSFCVMRLRKSANKAIKNTAEYIL
jgi:paraquat-inducible protein A